MKKRLFTKSLFDNLRNSFSGAGSVVGIDFGSSAIKIIELKRTKVSIKLANFLFKPIPLSVRASESEYRIFLEDTLREAMKDGRITGRNVYFCLNGTDVNIRFLTLPKMSQKDLRNAVVLELKKQGAFEPKDVYFDIKVSSEVSDRAGPKLQIIVATTKRQIVDQNLKIIDKVGLYPVGINLLSDAFLNILERSGLLAGEDSIGLIDVGAKITTLNFFRQGTLEFSREITTAGDHITQALVRTVTLPDKEINITLEEAEKIKKECGIPRKEELEEKVDSLAKSHILAMLRPVLERLLTEIQRSVNYYRQMYKIAKIDRLLLSGGGSRLKNLDEFLSASFKGTKIERLDMLSILSGWTDPGVANQELLEELAPNLNVAFGLALGKRKTAIDLLPFEIKLHRKILMVKFVLKFTVPIILGVIFFFYFLLSAQALHYRRLIEKANTTLRSFDSTKVLIQEYDALKLKMEQRKSLLEKAVGRQPLWWGILKELGNINPDGVTLDRLQIVTGSKPLRLRLEGEIIPGYTTIDLALSQYLLSLDESPFFENVQLVSTVRDIYSITPRAKFEIVAEMVY